MNTDPKHLAQALADLGDSLAAIQHFASIEAAIADADQRLVTARAQVDLVAAECTRLKAEAREAVRAEQANVALLHIQIAMLKAEKTTLLAEIGKARG